MLTEAMRRVGWRECPSDEVRWAWEEKGGRWQVAVDLNDPPYRALDIVHLQGGSKYQRAFPWRPVNPQTWNVDWRGWGVVVPTEPGLWWRDDYNFPVQVVTSLMFDGTMIFMQIDDAGEWMDVGVVEDDGHWIAPCIKPEVLHESQG